MFNEEGRDEFNTYKLNSLFCHGNMILGKATVL